MRNFIAKMLVGVSLLISTPVMAQNPATVVCSSDQIAVTSLVQMFEAGDDKAGVSTSLTQYSTDDTKAIFDFVEKQLRQPLQRHEGILVAHRPEQPTVLVFFVNKGCAKYAGYITQKEFTGWNEMLKGV